ncbi:MAG: hypothetical protein ACRDQ0_07550 [Pseudonocardia sp.]
MRTVPIPITPFEHLGAELAASPGLIEALLAAHHDDGTGHCRTCTTTPGYGTHNVPVPCSIRQLAEYAARQATGGES